MLEVIRFGAGARRPRSLRRALPAVLLSTLLAAPVAAQSAAGEEEAHDPLAPEISLTGDFLFSWSGEEGRDAGADGFDLRSVELGLHGEIDARFDYTGVIHFSEEEVELEEAYLEARDWLPGGLTLRAGRFNLDFGRVNRLHDHDLRTIERPALMQELLGGSLRGTGLELHWSPRPEAELPLVLSASVIDRTEADSHSILGPAAGHSHDEEDEGGLPVRDVEDFAVNLRAVASFALGETGRCEVGGSWLLAPSRVAGLDPEDERDLDRDVAGLDITYTQRETEQGRGLLLQGEWILGDSEVGLLDDGGTPKISGDDTFTIGRNRARGVTGLAEWSTGKDWSFGISGSTYEHAEDPDEDSWDLGVHASWEPTEGHRLRLGVRRFEDLAREDGEEEIEADFTAIQLQWTVVIGEHEDH